MLPELLDQIPPDQEIASVTADGAFDTRKCHDAIAARGAAAFGHALEPVAGTPSLPPRKNANPGSQTPLVQSHETKPCVHHGASDGPYGDDGVGITAEVAQRPRCTASSCWGNVSRLGTSTVRSQSSKSASPC
jgi:hypothetical protein